MEADFPCFLCYLGSDSSSEVPGIYESVVGDCGAVVDQDPPKVDLSELDLYLDDVVVSVGLEPDTTSLVPLSASRLRLLQDTTMIESALDLDSLEESTSSVGAGSQAGLIKKKDTF
ncbi:Palmitoyltransferase zdhhc14 [Homalodisca vitripennis]|nr:Palmitoyltransferase zdhhc14 [Homalodisca vitripennis]